jgi:hypothetical protein
MMRAKIATATKSASTDIVMKAVTMTMTMKSVITSITMKIVKMMTAIEISN